MASTESYSLEYLSLKKTLNVESNTAPFMAELAISAGATNSAYGTTRPVSVVTSPTSDPRPMPSPNRYITGSTNPESSRSQARR